MKIVHYSSGYWQTVCGLSIPLFSVKNGPEATNKKKKVTCKKCLKKTGS